MLKNAHLNNTKTTEKCKAFISHCISLSDLEPPAAAVQIISSELEIFRRWQCSSFLEHSKKHIHNSTWCAKAELGSSHNFYDAINTLPWVGGVF